MHVIFEYDLFLKAAIIFLKNKLEIFIQSIQTRNTINISKFLFNYSLYTFCALCNKSKGIFWNLAASGLNSGFSINCKNKLHNLFLNPIKHLISYKSNYYLPGCLLLFLYLTYQLLYQSNLQFPL